MPDITVQFATQQKFPSAVLLKKWAYATLSLKKYKNSEMTIRIVKKSEIKKLNSLYRKKNKTTNVLSFPIHAENILGDIVICADVVKKEAMNQQKELKAHWAHMVIHGTLHLLGYDHVKEKDAIKMESKEIRILKTLGFPNPYKNF